MVVRKGGL